VQESQINGADSLRADDEVGYINLREYRPNSMINFLDSSLGKPVGNMDLLDNGKSMNIEDEQDKSQNTSSVQELDFTEEFETEKNIT
jgi:hypothetical protein